MASRLPVRLAARTVRQQYARAQFTTSSRYLEATNFTMPAMSPTMTEGNIASWKVKEGDSFSQGDVLLEIETDKASMDVEAQEDGIMAKIFAQDGSKNVQVGTRIAVLAEPDDDVSKLEIPADTSKPVESPKENVEKSKEEPKKASEPDAPKGTPENKRVDRDKPKASPEGSGQNPKYPFYPAVQSLILAKDLSDEEVAKIAATGPGGRLLKGDVLGYLGTINADYSRKQSDRISKLGHLDLSNIKIAPQKPQAPVGASAGPAVGAEAPQKPRETTVTLTISLAEVLKTQKRIQDTLGMTVPLSAFLARAVDQANDDLPLPRTAKPSSDALFNAVLGLDRLPKTSRGSFLPQIIALPSSVPSLPQVRPSRPASRKVDIIDILSGKMTPARSAEAKAYLNPARSSAPSVNTSVAGAMNIFSVSVPAGDEKRGRAFLERMKTFLQVEPGSLVL